MEVHRSAQRHGIDMADMEYMVAHALVALDEENEEGINQVNAMNMQTRYERYLLTGGADA